MAYKVTLIPGDGIGPEITRATKRVLEATGVSFRWELAVAGNRAQDMFGTPLPDYVLDSITRNKVALKGPITTPVGHGFRSVNVVLRQTLNLYACLRPCKTYPGAPSLYSDVDIVIVRENTEGLYGGVEFDVWSPGALKLQELISEVLDKQVGKDTGFSVKITSERASRRIVKFAFDYAKDHGRKKVTAVHKANILRSSDGFFLDIAREVAREYPQIEFDEVIIDALCMELVRKPHLFDVLVLPNLYGDFISDLCAGLVGGMGVVPGANIGDGVAIFEPNHGSAPKYSGKNKVNPMAMMLSGVMMLRHLGEVEAADRLEGAIASVVAEGKSVTYDLKPNHHPPVGTSEAADAVIEKLNA
jgi:isocitrate dehydrogenase (NAD+)